MSVTRDMLIELFIMGTIFGIIISVILSRKILKSYFESKNKSNEISSKVVEISDSEEPQEAEMEISTGELRLIGVDERTAALIIASVCDHLKTPLDELQFKSIKAIEE